MPKEAKHIVVLDLETTGTDEHKDAILELGMVITDRTLTIERAYHYTIAPDKESWWNINFDPDYDFVRRMHTDNGLLADVARHGLDRMDVEAILVREFAGLGEKHDFLMAGSGVGHFDRRFIKAVWPQWERWFQYPVLDIGVVRRFGELAGVQSPDLTTSKPHRALEDAKLHLEEMRWWKTYLGSAEELRREILKPEL